jgi:hypothetical protein
VRIDVNTFVGRFPWRPHPGGTAHALRQAMERTGLDECWVSHLSAPWWPDPAAGNQLLYRALEREPGLRPVPAAHPGLPGWEAELDGALAAAAPCVRADPGCWGVAPDGPEMRQLAAAAAARGLPLLLAVRFEDGRQRHPLDAAPPLEPWAVRALVRADPAVRLVVTHADREFVEQVHWGATPAEAVRLLWDISWVWGPPEDHLAHLVDTMGPERFCLGSGQPLRLPETPLARLDLTPLAPPARAAIEGGNARRFDAAAGRARAGAGLRPGGT